MSTVSILVSQTSKEWYEGSVCVCYCSSIGCRIILYFLIGALNPVSVQHGEMTGVCYNVIRCHCYFSVFCFSRRAFSGSDRQNRPVWAPLWPTRAVCHWLQGLFRKWMRDDKWKRGDSECVLREHLVFISVRHQELFWHELPTLHGAGRSRSDVL